MPKYVLCLRTCAEDLSSSHNFQWPKKGPVACTDWEPKPECGHGLHGLLWGVGDASYLDYSDASRKWLVVKVRADEVVDIENKVKFPRGQVVYCGSRDRAVSYIQQRAPKHSNVVFGKFPRRYKAIDVAGIKAAHDNLTGLTWEAEGSNTYMNHADAVKYCEALGPGWRMPTHDELRTIVDYRNKGMKINEAFFKCHGWWYWSSTQYTPASGFAWGVDFFDGYSGVLGHGDDHYVRAVRASQS